MNLELHRQDLLQVASTAKRTMCVLPPGNNKKQQKLVIGDDEGVVTCVAFKKAEPQVVFKTFSLGKDISRVELGGPHDGVRDKVFASAGQKILGVSRKGKKICDFNTNLSEPITSMYVDDNNIYTSGEYTFQLFADKKESAFYMAEDRINDTFADRLEVVADDTSPLSTILGCHDRCVRVLRGPELAYQANVDGPVTSLCRYSFTPNLNNMREVLYGTQNGIIGQLELRGDHDTQSWHIPNVRGLGGVNHVTTYDITKDDVKDILVGRDDGTIEVFTTAGGTQHPGLLYSANVNESVSSVDGGMVTWSGHEDVIVSTYSGKIISFGNAPVETKEEELGEKVDKMKERKVAALRREVEMLEEQLVREKERYARTLGAEGGQPGMGGGATQLIAGGEEFKTNNKFVLNPQDASYTLTCELTTPIDCVAVQSDIPLDLIDQPAADATARANSNVIPSVSKVDSSVSSGAFLATFRCQEGGTHVDIRMRAQEGQSGTLSVFIIPRAEPKTCQVYSYPIRPLSLHERVHQIEQTTRPWNEARLTGSFSLAEMHMWIAMCLPDVPSRPSGDDMMLMFRSSILGTVLECRYRKNEAIFRTDNLSTLATLKEFVTREATNRKVSLNVSLDTKNESASHVLALIQPLLSYQHFLSEKKQLISGLKELDMQEEEASQFLSKEYQAVLQNQEQIEREYQQGPRRLEFLQNIVVDLFVHMKALKSKNVKPKIPMLKSLLEKYDHDEVVKFFFAN